MIVGIGVDTVEIERFERSLARTPALLNRLFSEGERGLPPASRAARFAAKEALIKALGGDRDLSWRDLIVPKTNESRPEFERTAALERILAHLSITRVHLSLTHDAGVATAFVVLEGGNG
ncbi:holo-ACP synthase [Lysinibacter sp. HNR]|uniref:holo-ACP synthase n=1 Tax=Lysinibacter sp. HNR TaxID=3031408 RepID=UPI002434C3D4|nr:holo-ACP synthase [Lysinibacter sp. HNR]WGD36706.1 holo-ACP synthase [Lysinibacter sp. HNR]